jgi:hypothetical protein
MDGPNFDPRVGEEVRVGFRPGIFKITKVRPAGEEHPNQNLHTPESHPSALWICGRTAVALNCLQYLGIGWITSMRRASVRRTIEWLKTSPDGRKYPDYIVDYEVTAEDDHAGNPSIYVRFLVDPDYFFEEWQAI